LNGSKDAIEMKFKTLSECRQFSEVIAYDLKIKKMDNFKQASRIGLRVSTTQGLLSVEQLWTLSLNKLSVIIKNVKKTLKGSEGDDELSFLDETKTVDKEVQLTFDILKDIYLTKKLEAEEEKNVAQRKLNNERIMSLIHKKQNEKLENMSEEELQSLLQ
jgi:hypothetical protein